MSANIRMERIEKLLRELEYEVIRGMLDREVDEYLSYRFCVPLSQHYKGGVVSCEFRTMPAPISSIDGRETKLRVVK
jgi:hypothetical protein